LALPPRRPRAFTLAELVLSLALMTVLMGGVISALALAGRAIPTPDDPLQAVVDATGALEQMTQDLQCAQTFPELAGRAISFTVTDRTGDGQPEGVRYSWSGAAGDPLVRSCSDGANTITTDVVPGVDGFALSYDFATQPYTAIEDRDTEQPEVLLGSFTGWSGVTPTTYGYSISSVDWIAELFGLTPPANAVSLRFTRASLRVAKGSTANSAYTVGIYTARSDPGNPRPEATTMGTPVTLSTKGATSTYAWVEAVFTDAITTDLTLPYAVMAKGSVTGSADVLYYTSSSGTDNGVILRGTHDGGSSWVPTPPNVNRYDMPFYVYGAYTTRGPQEVTLLRYFLTGVRITLTTPAPAATSAETKVRILNMPEITQP